MQPSAGGPKSGVMPHTSCHRHIFKKKSDWVSFAIALKSGLALTLPVSIPVPGAASEIAEKLTFLLYQKSNLFPVFLLVLPCPSRTYSAYVKSPVRFWRDGLGLNINTACSCPTPFRHYREVEHDRTEQ